jgi:hypothetical protein
MSSRPGQLCFLALCSHCGASSRISRECYPLRRQSRRLVALRRPAQKLPFWKSRCVRIVVEEITSGVYVSKKAAEVAECINPTRYSAARCGTITDPAVPNEDALVQRRCIAAIMYLGMQIRAKFPSCTYFQSSISSCGIYQCMSALTITIALRRRCRIRLTNRGCCMVT